MISSIVTWLIVSVLSLTGAFVVTLLYNELADGLATREDGMPLIARVITALLLIGMALGVPFATVKMAREIGGDAAIAAVLSVITAVVAVLFFALLLGYANACQFGDGWPMGNTCQ